MRDRIPSRLGTISAEPEVRLGLTSCEIAEIKCRMLKRLYHPGAPEKAEIFKWGVIT